MDQSSEVISEPITTDDNQKESDEENKQSLLSLEDAILSRLIYSSAVFKSQQKDEPELSMEEKEKIASDLLHKSHSQFLSRFGKYLNDNLLEYFLIIDKDDYEIIHHVNKLKRYFDNDTRKIDKKNRRYEALKSLIEKGEYFSETAMMNRNPLLYDNLVGKYLTEDEKKVRDSVDEKDNTLVNRILKGIDKNEADELKKQQEDAEHDVMEENDSDSESDDKDAESDETDINSLKNENDENKKQSELQNKTDNYSLRWGNIPISEEDKREEQANSSKILLREFISSKEQKVLRDEFVTHMYQSFLDGKDLDFDYSTVDENEAFDNLDLKTHDEEEKYFDSESPEWVASPKIQDKVQEDESEDELDKYINSLKEQSHTNDDHLKKNST